jgi:hypothetical protein
MINYLKAQLLSNWGFARIIRLGLGIVMIIQAFQMSNFMVGVFGSFFAWQGLLNKGCGVGGCGVPMYRDTKTIDAEENETTYTEIKKDN